ncbi:MAG TPA: efflux RND transporter periplasmic adaptor subunit [Candidatus Binataceae bacterium]|jgi:multidrug efflux pump subunit AcrA (membrane-fusion protein)|nr:efflux RND transporter periplasmic adaptor subunit [Candidatus Binataceae bacterium]
MMRRLRLTAIATALALALTFAGCGKGGSSGDTQEEAPPVVMSVTAAKVRIAPMRQEFHLLGTTVAMRHITLRAPAAGRVIGLNLQNGDRVRAGQVVAHLLNREVEAAEQGLEVARQIDPAEAASMARSVNRYTHDPGIAVRAPENALVSQRIVSSGQMVNDLDPLVDLIDPNSIYVEAAVPVDDVSLVRPGMSATVTTALQPGVDYPVRVAALSPIFTQGAAASSSARMEFVGARKIKDAGAPVEIQVTIKTAPDAIVIPAAALFQDAANDAFYVFVAAPDGKAHRTKVTVGIRTPAEVQITSGLTPGQLVITSGGYALSDGLKVKVTVAQS